MVPEQLPLRGKSRAQGAASARGDLETGRTRDESSDGEQTPRHDQERSDQNENRGTDAVSADVPPWVQEVIEQIMHEQDRRRDWPGRFQDLAARNEMEYEALPEEQKHEVDGLMEGQRDHMEKVLGDIESRDSGLHDEAQNELSRQRDPHAQERPSLELGCDFCQRTIAIEDSFMQCAQCLRSNWEAGMDEDMSALLYPMMCHRCYIDGVEHSHDTFLPWSTSFGIPRVIKPFSTAYDQVRLQTEPQTIGQDSYRDQRQSKERPISKTMRAYLLAVLPEGHQFESEIKDLQAITGTVQRSPAFRTLQSWATACLLLAGKPKEGTLSFVALLSPMQRASFALLKEWYFSEIQDPRIMTRTISSMVTSALAPGGNDAIDVWIEERRNKYDETKHEYHGDLVQLFHAEFDTYPNGDPGGASANLYSKRATASMQACKQRIAYLALHPSMQPTWFLTDRNLMLESDLDLNCRFWKYNLRGACLELLSLIKLTNGPETFCWIVIDLAMDGPVELFKAQHAYPEGTLGQKRLTASLAPLPWLSRKEVYSAYPHFLWDARLQKVVETSEHFRPAYVAISHTWGRWRRTSSPRLAVPGVPWTIAQNTLWDVREIPQQMRRVPGAFRYIWLDLVCIPQDLEADDSLSDIAHREIAKQAAIFGNATNAIAWLNTVSDLEMGNLRECVALLAATCGRFHGYKTEWDFLEELKPGLKTGDYPEPKVQQTLRERIPLIRSERRSTIDMGLDPLQDINQWFTSLWTLQEACMRPDMWLCSRNWKPLRLYDTPDWQSWHNISLDGIVSLLDHYRNNNIMHALRFEGSMPDDTLSKDEAAGDRRSQFENELKFTRSHAFDKSLYQDASNPENAIKTGKTQDIITRMPYTVHVLYAMFQTLGLKYLLRTSPMDILVLGDLRECRHRRAEAIMSAIGATEWYGQARSDDSLVLNRYPLSFLRNVRTKVGDGDFFRARTLTRKSLRLIDDFTATGKVPKAAGTLMPFGTENVFDVTLCYDRLVGDPVSYESHPSLASWRIETNGAVIIAEVAVLHSVYATSTNCECLEIMVDENGVYEGESEGISQSLRCFRGRASEWFETRKDLCYLICLDRVATLSHISTASIEHYNSHGVVLKELKPGVLVKIGAYLASGCKRHVFPDSKAVSWTIL